MLNINTQLIELIENYNKSVTIRVKKIRKEKIDVQKHTKDLGIKWVNER